MISPIETTHNMNKTIIYLLLLVPYGIGALSTPSTTAAKSKILKGIDASQFRHPLDRDLTNFFSNAPLSNVASSTIQRSLSIVEQGVRLDLLSSSVKVSPNQLPELYDSMQEAASFYELNVGSRHVPWTRRHSRIPVEQS